MKAALGTIFGLILALAISACSGPEQAADPRLQKAVSAMTYMTTERFLSRSAFSHAHPETKPSAFVSYLFSDLGTAEWPIALDRDEEEQLRSARIPALPRDLPVHPHRPDPAVDLQVVVRADDAAGVVIIEGYAKAGEAPLLVEKRRLPE